MGSLLGAIVTGLVVGGAYRFMLSGGRSPGMSPVLVVAVVGAVAARYAGRAVFGNVPMLGIILSLAGAAIAVGIYRAVAED